MFQSLQLHKNLKMASAVAIISAEAKRGVSLANLIGVRVRNHLIVDDISDLMTILLLGKTRLGCNSFGQIMVQLQP